MLDGVDKRECHVADVDVVPLEACFEEHDKTVVVGGGGVQNSKERGDVAHLRQFSPFEHDLTTRETYVYNEERYSSQAAGQRMVRQIISTIAQHRSAIRSIVDVGCGDGILIGAIKAALPDVEISAFDAAPGAVALAAARQPNIRFFHWDMYDAYPLGDTRFELAICDGVLHHVKDPAAALKTLSRIADRLLILEPNGYNPLLKVAEKTSRYMREHHERSFTRWTLVRWCKDAGFQVTETQYVRFVPFFFPTPLAKLANSLEPWFERIPLFRNVFAGTVVLYGVKVRVVSGPRRAA
jgi:ubiquinone/menaquinone biosynthesis C-methylase UbiE